MKKSYNRLALQGLDFDDMEFVQEFNLDSSVAYTPKINFAMLDNVYQKHVKHLIDDGMSTEKAKMVAGRSRANAKRDIMQLI